MSGVHINRPSISFVSDGTVEGSEVRDAETGAVLPWITRAKWDRAARTLVVTFVEVEIDARLPDQGEIAAE